MRAEEVVAKKPSVPKDKGAPDAVSASQVRKLR